MSTDELKRTGVRDTFILETSYTFEAAHALPLSKDNRSLHGHSWRVVVRVRSKGIVRLGRHSQMVMEQSQLDALVQPVIDRLDHCNLNDKREDFPGWQHPTSEKVARFVGQEFQGKLPAGVTVERIRVEKAGASAEWVPA